MVAPDLAGCGVVMVATRNHGYVVLGASCAASIRRHVPGLEITLFTNVRAIPPEYAGRFDHIVEIESPTRHPLEWANGLMDKIRGIRESPYDKSFFIDVDTVVRSAELASAFAMLDAHDLLITECAEDASYSRRLIGRPLYSTGILAWRRCDKAKQLFSAWTDFGLECLAAARDGRLAELPDLAALSEDERTFLALTDQYTLARFLAPGVNAFDLDLELLEERWNFRGDGKRPPPANLIVDHRMDVKQGKSLFSG
ncbi:MAG: hypothetical protein H7X93_13835 [Sphingomonadaceae bacterium]|nr:hypothetical protein [Sphingomonadaceae bacterium]